MPLQEMPAEARIGQQRALKVDVGALRELAEVCAAQGFRGDTDLEGVAAGGELGDSQTGAVDGDGVAEVAVAEDGGGARDCEGGAAAAGGGLVEGLEEGDGWAGG